jgi:hypothetical protein
VANYNVDIEFAVKGQQRLNQVKSSLSQINQLTQSLKPLNLLAPGGGKLADQVRQAMKPLKDFAREAQNGTKQYSNTLAGATAQARTFETVLKNVKVAAGGYSKQVSEVKGFADAFAQASAQAERLNRNLDKLKQDAFQRAGLPIGPASQLGTLEADLGRIEFERRKREQYSRPIGPEPRGASSFGRGGRGFGGLQSAALGVGFPLLFGGGAGSIAGGLLGSAGGFGGQILGSAIGQQIDQAVGAIAKLGQALNPLTADLDAVVNAAGKSGTEFEKLIKELEEVAGAEAALKAASEQLATEIGQDGVDALKQFGEESAELGNTFAVTLTQIGAAVAELINKTGVLKSIAEGLAFDVDLRKGRTNESGDAELRRLNLDRRNAGAKGVNVEEFLRLNNEAIVARQRELDLQKELNAQGRIETALKDAQVAKDADTVAILQAQVALKESGLDLTTQEGYNLAETVVLREFDKKEQELIAKGVSKEVRDLERKLALLNLSVEARKQENRQGKEFERKFQQNLKKRRQLQANLLAEGSKQQEIENKITEATEGRAAAIQRELADMQAAYTADAQRIILTTESRDLAQEKVNTLAKEYELKQLLLRQEYTELQLKKDLLAIQQKQTLAGISTDLNRQIEDANLRPTGNAMQDQELELRISQIRREQDARRDLENQIEKERAAILRYSEVGNASGVMDAQERVEGLQEQIALYDRLLPQLDAAEQAQLKFNQAFEAAKPIADAVTTGLFGAVSAIVDGTKSAEEAFADFLKNIGEMLIQAAAQQIATYIAIGIAKAFAFGGSTGPDFSQFGTNTTGVPTNFIGSGLSGFAGLAEGGFVTGPTPALVGEGGEPEYIIPQSKMRESMDRYSRGARGSAVIPAAGDSGASGAGGGVAVAAPIDVRFKVERINNVDYVTAAEFQEGMQQAAKQGAQRGEQQAIKRLQMSSSTRRRVGL